MASQHSSALVAGLICLMAVVVVVPIPWLTAEAAGESSIIGLPGCNTSCGAVDIPFPFGMGPPHCWLPGFEISCNYTGNGVLKPFLVTQANDTAPKEAITEVLSIDPEHAIATVLQPIYSYCYDAASRKMVLEPDQQYWDLGNNAPYSFASGYNKFTVVGCQTLAYIDDTSVDSASVYLTGCVSKCFDGNMSLNPCTGRGRCCQEAFTPKGLNYYEVGFNDFTDRANDTANLLGRCSFAVLMYWRCNFTLANSSNSISSPEELSALIWCKGADGGKAPLVSTASPSGGKVPVVLVWSIGDDDCNTAPTKPGYACVSTNSTCLNAYSYNGRRGYICRCNKGFDGNPYLPDGWQDDTNNVVVHIDRRWFRSHVQAVIWCLLW